MRSFLHNNLIILILLNSASVFNYLFQMVIGRSMTPSDYGIFNSINSTMSTIGAPIAIVHIVFSRFIVRLSVSGLGQVKMLLIKSFQVVLPLAGGLFITGLLFVPWLKSFLHLEVSTPIILMILTLCISILYPILFGMLEGLHRFSLYGLGTAGYTVMRFLGAVFLVSILGWGVNGAILAGTFAATFSLIYGIWGIRDLMKVKQEILPERIFNEMKQYAIPVFLFTLMIALLANIDIILVRHYCSPEESGLYAVAAVIGRIALSLPSSLLNVLFPSAAKAQATQQDDRYILCMGLTLFLGACVAMVCYLWPAEIISLLFGEQYIEASNILQIIGISMAFLAGANVLFSYSLARSEFSFLWLLFGGVVLMASLIFLFHDSAMTIAKTILSTCGTLFLGAVIWLVIVQNNTYSSVIKK